MNIESVVDASAGLNWQTIIGIFAVVWYCTHDIKREVKSTHDDLRIMNTRIGRLEGTVYGREVYNKIDKD